MKYSLFILQHLSICIQMTDATVTALIVLDCSFLYLQSSHHMFKNISYNLFSVFLIILFEISIHSYNIWKYSYTTTFLLLLQIPIYAPPSQLYIFKDFLIYLLFLCENMCLGLSNVFKDQREAWDFLELFQKSNAYS